MPPRIASLVPSATETLFALGLGDAVVAVTHECDYPPEAAELPHLTRSIVPEGLGPADIDRAVRERTERGEAIYELDHSLLRELQPDLIVTQAVCEVCAVSYDDVVAVAQELSPVPEVLSLDPSTLGEVLAGVRDLAAAAWVPEEGERLVGLLGERLDRVTGCLVGADRPRTAALEWLDPPYVGGHWVPQMIELAGGEDVLGFAGERSRVVGWDELAAARPDVVAIVPCGYDAARAAEEARGYAEPLAALGAETMVAFDAAAYFSRPGPRLVDGVELLAHVLHPDRTDTPPAGRAIALARDPAGAT
ncbi:MAG: iron complex transport system substrate-binding protein [Thermoleophilaceae bacterium]|jgi:iron complex transport system substrate-binding protein|nr:iron complex transport system substrate-binding protein [Thermoleophilaceae bacterium]